MESTPSSLCPLPSAAGVPDCSLNPSLIPLFLGLAALCALGYLGFVVYAFWPPTGGARKLLTEVAKDSGMFLGQLALIMSAWLFFLVPYDHIPFITPPASGNFLIWPASPAYGFVAGVLHIVVPVAALQLAVGLVFGQLLFGVRLIWRCGAKTPGLSHGDAAPPRCLCSPTSRPQGRRTGTLVAVALGRDRTGYDQASALVRRLSAQASPFGEWSMR